MTNRARRRGFTIVEVMVSLGVMTIGAMAIIAMQQQTTRANVQAREQTVAMQIAQNWIERLKIDAINWANTSGTPATDLANTTWLIAIVGTGGEGAFMPIAPAMTFVNTPQFQSNGFDYYGNDISTTTAMASVAYCASYRLTWIYVDRAMRVDVRVWWPREGIGATLSPVFDGCSDNNALLNPAIGGNSAGAQSGRFHVVYLSTVIRNLKY